MEQSSVLVKSQISSSITKSEENRAKTSRKIGSICEKVILALTVISAVMIVFIFIFTFNKSWEVFRINGLNFILGRGFDGQISEAFRAPADAPHWVFGSLGLLVGTLTTTLGALVIAVPMGIGTAIVIAELAPARIKSFLTSVVRLLASIPSIIFGLVGLMVIMPFISEHLISVDMQIFFLENYNLQLTGNSMLAGIIVLSIMIVPIIVALSVDAINAVPFKYKEASLALGLSHWRTIVKVILPAAKSGILAGIILAAGRAIGEAIALSMVCGGVGNIPNPAHGAAFLFTPILTLASAIVNKSEIMSVPSIESALFACGVVLLLTSTLLSLFTRVVERVMKRREGFE